MKLKPIVKNLLLTAGLGVAVFVLLQFYPPFWRWENTVPLPSVQEVNQRFGVTFPAQAQVIGYEDYDTWGTYQLCAVVRMRRRDLVSFLAQPELKTCPPSEIADAKAILLDAPELLDNPSVWKVSKVRRYQMVLNVREPLHIDVKDLKDCQQLLIDLDTPKFATVYIEWTS